MEQIDYELLVKKLIIFNNSDSRTIRCNNCLRNLCVTTLINHMKNIFCNKDCFWTYYINNGTVKYKKTYIHPEYVITDKFYIIKYYKWDNNLRKQEKNNFKDEPKSTSI